MQMRSLFIGYTAGIALLGVGGSVTLLLLGDISADAGSRWMTFVYALFTWGALVAAGGGALTAVVFRVRGALPRPRRCFYLGALAGAASALALATRLFQSTVTSLRPVVGRSAWLVACGLAGVTAGLLIVTVATAHRFAASAPR